MITILGAALCAVPSMAQDRPMGRIIKIPPERGLYYDGPAGLVSLPTQVFMPTQGGALKQMLGLGSRKLRAVMPGANAAVVIPNPRPTFYYRGDRPGNLTYLVRGERKIDHREFRMSRSRHDTEWAQFRQESLTSVEIEPLGGDLAVIRPTADLSTGEYVIVAVLEPRFRAIRLAFDFGVMQAAR